MAVDRGNIEIAEFLIKHGADDLSPGKKPHLPLRYAVSKGDFAMTALLLENGANVNDRPLPPLYIALKNGHSEIAALLIEKGADVNAEYEYGWSPLRQAAYYGNKKIATLLIEKGANINYKKGEYGWSPLREAITRGHYKLATDLIKNGADISGAELVNWGFPGMIQSQVGYIEMMRILATKGFEFTLSVASKLGDGDLVEELLSSRDDAYDSLNEILIKALYDAIGYGQEEIVFLLIEKIPINKDSSIFKHLLFGAAAQCMEKLMVYLVNHGADVNMGRESGRALLHEAARHGHTKIVALLIEKGAVIDAADKEGKTPFSCALEKNHFEVARLLADKGVQCDIITASQIGYTKGVQEFLDSGNYDINEKDERGRTLLHLAVIGGHVEVVALLIEKGTDINAIDKYSGEPPLHAAIINGHEDMASFLIENGADIDAQTPRGDLPIHLAAKNGHEKVVALLIQKGADVNTIGKNAWVPLHCVAWRWNGTERMASFLIENGADVDALSIDSRTHLSVAADSGNEEVAALLLEKGANVNAKDSNGQTPLHYAAKYYKPRENDLEIAKLLLEKGALLTEDIDNRTPIYWAMVRQNEELIEFLASEGDNINRFVDYYENGMIGQVIFDSNYEDAVDPDKLMRIIIFLIEKGFDVCYNEKNGGTLLHWALRSETYKEELPELTNLLIKKGVDVNAVDYYGFTALHLALQTFDDYINLDYIKLLVKGGADVNAQDNDGNTPLYYAEDEEIRYYLISEGALSE
ncbi:MAG: ankyrin repeat domain-containing protein [Candidatus Eremiobacteraeota bacterium]|nr:ankyrin repeat domain-containing protein [Candidatus Eremiobacteraeota bacterium]